MTDPLAIVAGIPLGVYQRSKHKPTRAGWTIQVVASQQHRRADLGGIWRRVMALADRAPASGTHLVLAHDREDQRPTFTELESRSYRAVWLPRRLAMAYGQPEFQVALDDLLRFEECWRDRIRPKMDSPLLLPETAFAATQSVADAWTRARHVSRDKDRIEAVEKAIGRFRQTHRQRGEWRDTKALNFRTGPRHGHHGLPSWRRRKLTLQLPSGFHFDVQHQHGHSFRIECQSGQTRRIRTYANVDAHGYVR